MKRNLRRVGYPNKTKPFLFYLPDKSKSIWMYKQQTNKPLLLLVDSLYS